MSDPARTAYEDAVRRIDQLETDLAGERKANQILNAGFVSTCEDRDRLKQRVRELESKLKETGQCH